MSTKELNVLLNDLTTFQEQVFTLSKKLEDIQLDYDKYKEQVENEVHPTVPQVAQQQAQTSVLSIDDNNNEFSEYEGERVRVCFPSTRTILLDKEDLKVQTGYKCVRCYHRTERSRL